MCRPVLVTCGAQDAHAHREAEPCSNQSRHTSSTHPDRATYAALRSGGLGTGAASADSRKSQLGRVALQPADLGKIAIRFQVNTIQK
jgi:hypothetical protein